MVLCMGQRCAFLCKLLATIAGEKGKTGCPIDGLAKVHASVCRFFGKKIRQLPLNRCPEIDCGCTHVQDNDDWSKTKKKRFRTRPSKGVKIDSDAAKAGLPGVSKTCPQKQYIKEMLMRTYFLW